MSRNNLLHHLVYTSSNLEDSTDELKLILAYLVYLSFLVFNIANQ